MSLGTVQKTVETTSIFLKTETSYITQLQLVS